MRSKPVMGWDRARLIFSMVLIAQTKVIDADYNYEESPLNVGLGECVNFTAKAHFIEIRQATNDLEIIWKKDTIVIPNKKTWLYISYAKKTDAAFYEVSVKSKKSRIVEKTFFWLNVAVCKPNQKESQDVTAKCTSSCVEFCPTNWHYSHSPDGNRCYQYFGEPKTWTAASDACQAINGQLATANNYEENRFIGSLLLSGEGGWIGLNDRKSEASFVWSSAKTKIKFTSWAKNEPNNYNAKCNIENCVMMSKGNGKWSDVICNAFYPFVCESARRNESNWQCMKTKCYKFVESPLMWHDALSNCKSYGAILASIRNNEENNFIKNVITKDSWIGLNDIGEAGAFVWNQVTYSSQKLPYTNWDANEPNDMVFSKRYGAAKCDGEDCVLLKEWQSQSFWYDVDCASKKPYVCEKIRDSLLPSGLVIGIIVGSMIAIAVIAGIMNSAMRKRNRAHIKASLISAYEKDLSEMSERRTHSFRNVVVKARR